MLLATILLFNTFCATQAICDPPVPQDGLSQVALKQQQNIQNTMYKTKLQNKYSTFQKSFPSIFCSKLGS